MNKMKRFAAFCAAQVLAVGVAFAGPQSMSSTQYELQYSLGTFGNSAGYTGNVTFELVPAAVYQNGFTEVVVAESTLWHNSPSLPGESNRAAAKPPSTIFNVTSGLDDVFATGLSNTQWVGGVTSNSNYATIARGSVVSRAAVGGTTETRSDTNSQVHVIATLGPYTALYLKANSMQQVGYAEMASSVSLNAATSSSGVELNYGVLRTDGTYQLAAAPLFAGQTMAPDSSQPSKTVSATKTLSKGIYNTTASPMKVLLRVAGFGSAKVGPN